MSAAGFASLVGQTGPGDLSKLIALRALVDRVNGDGTVERANWLTGVREEYRRWYARHQAAGHPENFPADETLRYLDEHIVRTLAGEGVLQPSSFPARTTGRTPPARCPGTPCGFPRGPPRRWTASGTRCWTCWTRGYEPFWSTPTTPVRPAPPPA